MGANTFYFKHFAVEQEGSAMKVGTDGVLLGAWCRIEPMDEAMLDVGTGNGLITLMLAQRTEKFTGVSAKMPTIEAVEIDPAACKTAQRNFEASKWSDRISLHCVDAQYFMSTNKFDHIVSNPPFFIDSLTPPDQSRSTARHAKSLTYEALIALSDRLLRKDGRISMILPTGAETQKMIFIAGAQGFVVSRRTDVHSTLKSGSKRTLIEFSRINPEQNQINVKPEILTIHGADLGSFSAEYRALTSDFYLKF
jgi:tRNA1Val (adenine37-N6)-methyltransferase